MLFCAFLKNLAQFSSLMCKKTHVIRKYAIFCFLFWSHIFIELQETTKPIYEDHTVEETLEEEPKT